MANPAQDHKSTLLLTYRKLFFCNYVGNLTGIYDASYFGKNTWQQETTRLMHLLSILKQQRAAITCTTQS
jgi:hypothetical protein